MKSTGNHLSNSLEKGTGCLNCILHSAKRCLPERYAIENDLPARLDTHWPLSGGWVLTHIDRCCHRLGHACTPQLQNDWNGSVLVVVISQFGIHNILQVSEKFDWLVISRNDEITSSHPRAGGRRVGNNGANLGQEHRFTKAKGKGEEYHC